MTLDLTSGRIPFFGGTKVQGIIVHFPHSLPSSHASLSRQSRAAAEARRRRIAHLGVFSFLVGLTWINLD
jgi:hypothetical protein